MTRGRHAASSNGPTTHKAQTKEPKAPPAEGQNPPTEPLPPPDRPARHRSSPGPPAVQEGEVLAVGNGAVGDDNERIPLDLKPGDKILFGKWGGTEVKIDGEDLLIMKESDVMGVIEA